MDKEDKPSSEEKNSEQKDTKDLNKAHKPQCWSELPGNLLEKVYSFLGARDECQMSLVCRNWLNEYHAPGLWRNRTVKFLLAERHRLDDHLARAEHHAHRFRRVEINLSSLNADLLEAHNKLKCFLEILTRKSQLHMLKVRNSWNVFHHPIIHIHGDILITLQNLLVIQSSLKELGFYGGEFELRDVAELLRAVSVTNTPFLRSLTLRDFVDSPASRLPEGSAVDLEFLRAFVNLDTLETEYTSIFSDAIFGLLNSRYEVQPLGCDERGNLKRIVLHCTSLRSRRIRSISPEAWINLSDMCPSVTVDLKMRVNLMYVKDLIERYIVLNMPLRSLGFLQERTVYAFQDFRTLLNRLLRCGTTETLEELKISWPHNPLNLEHGLRWFLDVFPKLRTFRLCASHPVKGLESLFNAWCQNKPASLKTVEISILNVFTRRAVAVYRGIAELYVPVLENIGLEVSIIANLQVERLV